MDNHRYFSSFAFDRSVVLHWNESCLIGDAIAEIAGHELRNVIESENPSRLVMNFSKVNGVSSSMISCFIKMQRLLKRSGGHLCFAGLTPTMHQIFKTMNLLNTHFQFFNTVEEALMNSNAPLDVELQMRIEQFI